MAIDRDLEIRVERYHNELLRAIDELRDEQNDLRGSLRDVLHGRCDILGDAINTVQNELNDKINAVKNEGEKHGDHGEG